MISKMLRLSEDLTARLTKCLTAKGLNFTEFARRALDELLTKEGY